MAIHTLASYRHNYPRPLFYPIANSGLIGATPPNTLPSQGQPTKDQLTAQLLYVPRTVWVTGLAVMCNTAHATAKLSMALYNDSAGQPGSRYIAGGEVTFAAVGLKIVAVTGQWVPAGWYWSAVNTDTAAGGSFVQPLYTTSAPIPLLGKATLGGANQFRSWIKALAYATPLPDPFSASGAYSASAVPTDVYLLYQDKRVYEA